MEPLDPDNFPLAVSAEIVSNNLLKGSTRRINSFKFKVITSANGPVFSGTNGRDGVKRCREEAGLQQFEFKYPVAPGISLTSTRETHPKNVSNWHPNNKACFIKILTTGEGPLFLVTSYWPNETYRYGNSVVTAERVPGKNKFVACVEIRCPGNVYHPNSKKQLPEWTYLHVTHLTGKCNLKDIKNNLANQENLYGDNRGNCSHYSKSHSPGSAEAWLCVPLPNGGFDIDFVYTGNKNDLTIGKNRCLNGKNDWSKGQPSQVNEKRPTVTIPCR